MGASAGAIRAGRAFIELFADDSPLKRDLKRVQSGMKEWGSSITSLGTKIFAGGAAALGPLVGAAKVFADMGSHFNDMSARTGVSVEALSTLGFAARQSGTDMETLEGGLRKMQKNITAAADGSEEAAMALAHIGLSIEALRGLTPDEQFRKIGHAVSQVADPTERAAAALAIFGKSGTALLPMLEGGAAGLREMESQARALGLEMSTQDAQAADSLGDKLDALWDTVKMGTFAVGSALAPALEELVSQATNVIVSTTNWIKENKGLIVTVATVAAAIAGVGASLIGIGMLLTGAATAMGVLGTILGAILSPIGLTVAALAGLGYAFVTYTDMGQRALGWLMDKFRELKTDALTTFQGISDTLSAGDITLAMKILWLSLKMEWVKGTNFLRDKWDAVTGSLASVAINAFAGIQAAWTKVTFALSDIWAGLITGFKKGWIDWQNWFAKRVIDVQEMAGLLSPEEATDARRSLEKDRKQRLQEVGGAGAGAARQKALDDIESRRQADQDSLAEEMKARQAGRDKALNDLMAERDAALAEAKNKAAAAGAGKDKKGNAGIADDVAAAAKHAKDKGAGIGGEDVRSKEGFQKLAASLRQGGDDPSQQIARTTKEQLALQKLQWRDGQKTRERLEKLTVRDF